MTLRAVDPFVGDKGFGNIGTDGLVQRLVQYKKLRDHERTPPALQDYARQAVREIRTELQRRSAGPVAA